MNVYNLSDRSERWLNFHFYCINPFLSCRDWVALSWCCRTFYHECNLKRTLPRKFRNDLLRVLFTKEHPQWVDTLWKGLIEHNGMLSGGSMVSIFCQCPHDGDVDIFYQSPEWNSFGLDTPGMTQVGLAPSTPTFHIVNSGNHEMRHISGQFIKDIVNIRTSQTPTIWQFINTNPNFLLPETTPQRIIMSPRDHVMGIIDTAFDLEFCKIAYHPKQLQICNLRSIVYQQSKLLFPHNMEELTVSNWKNVSIVNPKLEQRAQKYIDRGFRIINHEDLLSVVQIQNVLKCVEKYEVSMIRYNAEENQRLKKEKEEKRKQAEREKQNQELVDKWMKFSDDTTEEKDIRSTHYQIPFHRQYIPIVEWVTQYCISPDVVYKVLCYGCQPDLIDLCFDKKTIPRQWLSLEECHARNYYYAVFPERLSDSVFTRYFWKLISKKWPNHFWDLNSKEYRQVQKSG